MPQANVEVVRTVFDAVNRGEWRASVWGIGAPVFDRHDKVISAIGISGPRERVEPNIKAFAEAVSAAAKELSRRLGALDRPPVESAHPKTQSRATAGRRRSSPS